MIGNHVNAKVFREFESLHLRQFPALPKGLSGILLYILLLLNIIKNCFLGGSGGGSRFILSKKDCQISGSPQLKALMA